MEQLTLILDFALIGMAIWMITIVTGYGGIVGRAFNTIGWGAIIMGVAHFIETISFGLLGWNPEIIEVSHRVIVLLGFILIVMGFRKFMQTK